MKPLEIRKNFSAAAFVLGLFLLSPASRADYTIPASQFDACLAACQTAPDATALAPCTGLVGLDELDLIQMGTEWARQNIDSKCGRNQKEGETLGEARASRISSLCDANGSQKIRMVLKGAASVCQEHWKTASKRSSSAKTKITR